MALDIPEYLPEPERSNDTGTGFRRLLRQCRSHLRTLFTAHTPDNPDQGIYMPESVNSDLKTNGTIRAETLMGVLEHPGFRDLGISLTLKMLDRHPCQPELLKALASSIRWEKTAHTERARTMRSYLQSTVHANAEVQGGKAAQVFRYGPHNFHQRFDALATRIKEEGKVPCLIAYSALLGLQSFTEAAEKGDSIVILRKDVLQTDEGHCGYIVHVGEEDCEVIDLYENTDLGLLTAARPAVLVDDTIKNGRTIQKVREDFMQRIHFPELAEQPACIVKLNRSVGHNQTGKKESPLQ